MFANLPRIKGSAVKRAIPATLQRIYARYPNAASSTVAPAMRAKVTFAGIGASCNLYIKPSQTRATKTRPSRTVASVEGSIILPTLADDSLLPRLHAEHWLAYALHELGHAMYSMPRTYRAGTLRFAAVQYASDRGEPSAQWARNSALLQHAWNCLEDPRLEHRLIADNVAANYGDVATPLMQSLIEKWPATLKGKKNLGLVVCYLGRTWLPANVRTAIRARVAPPLLALADSIVAKLWALPADTLAHSNITEADDPCLRPFARLVAELACEMQTAPAEQPTGPGPQPGEGEPGEGEPGEGEPGEGEPGEGEPGEGEGEPGEGEGEPGEGEGEPGEGEGEPGEGEGEPGEGEGEPGEGEGEPGEGEGEPGEGEGEPGDKPANERGDGAGRDSDTSTGALEPFVQGEDTLPEVFALPTESCKAPEGLPDPLSAFEPHVTRVLPNVDASELAAGARAFDAARHALVQNNAGAVAQHVRRLLSQTEQSEMRRGLRSGRLHVRSLPRVLAQHGENAFQRRLESGLENAAVVMALDASISMRGGYYREDAPFRLMGAAVFAISDAIRRCHGARFGAFTFRGSRYAWAPNVGYAADPVEFDGGQGQSGNCYTIKSISAPLHWPEYCARLNRAVCDVSGGTPELIGLAHAIKELIPVTAGRKFVLFFTDGDGFRSDRFHSLIEQAARYGITVIGFGMKSHIAPYFRPGHSVEVSDLKTLAGRAMSKLVDIIEAQSARMD